MLLKSYTIGLCANVLYTQAAPLPTSLLADVGLLSARALEVLSGERNSKRATALAPISF
jgi:hypothetical protein